MTHECNYCSTTIVPGETVARHHRGGLQHTDCIRNREHDLRHASLNLSNGPTRRLELSTAAARVTSYFDLPFTY